ncbi:MAG: ABC transporter permease [Clostridiales bacterium]|nr:ABC transporter permease [Clostridiales bacterium]
MKKTGLFFKKFYLGIILFFLYIPIVVMIFQSFNAGKSRAKWEGFSFRWYAELFQDRSIMNALQVTIAVAVIAAVISTILGTLAAIGIHAMKKRPQRLMMTLTNIPNTMPDIVTGISLMLLFLFTKVERGFVTMVMAHITFNTPYVILSVMPKLKQMNKHSYEAALDLGATPTYALTHVIIPEIRQGIVTGAMLAFTLSLDDFTISYFTTSPLVQNLSTLIYSKARIGIDPTLNALSTLMFVSLLILLVIVNRRTADNAA